MRFGAWKKIFAKSLAKLVPGLMYVFSVKCQHHKLISLHSIENDATLATAR